MLNAGKNDVNKVDIIKIALGCITGW